MDPHNAPISFAPDSLMTTLGIVVHELSADKVVATMPVHGNRQTAGLLHGGASAAIAETVGSLGAKAHAGDTWVAMGVDLNITHHRAVSDGTITATATPIHRGRTLATYGVTITDDAGNVVASARITSALRDLRVTREKQ